jgi:HK97 gp10 family phage protein
MRKAANVVKNAAVAKAQAFDRPETPLSIAKNIAVQFGSKQFKQTGDILMRVGVRGGAKSYANTNFNRQRKRVGQQYATEGTTFYWRFREFGTSHQRAQPFMLPSLEENVGTATDVAVSELNKQLDKLAK